MRKPRIFDQMMPDGGQFFQKKGVESADTHEFKGKVGRRTQPYEVRILLLSRQELFEKSQEYWRGRELEEFVSGEEMRERGNVEEAERGKSEGKSERGKSERGKSERGQENKERGKSEAERDRYGREKYVTLADGRRTIIPSYAYLSPDVRLPTSSVSKLAGNLSNNLAGNSESSPYSEYQPTDNPIKNSPSSECQPTNNPIKNSPTAGIVPPSIAPSIISPAEISPAGTNPSGTREIRAKRTQELTLEQKEQVLQSAGGRCEMCGFTGFFLNDVTILPGYRILDLVSIPELTIKNLTDGPGQYLNIHTREALDRLLVVDDWWMTYTWAVYCNVCLPFTTFEARQKLEIEERQRVPVSSPAELGLENASRYTFSIVAGQKITDLEIRRISEDSGVRKANIEAMFRGKLYPSHSVIYAMRRAIPDKLAGYYMNRFRWRLDPAVFCPFFFKNNLDFDSFSRCAGILFRGKFRLNPGNLLAKSSESSEISAPKKKKTRGRSKNGAFFIGAEDFSIFVRLLCIFGIRCEPLERLELTARKYLSPLRAARIGTKLLRALEL